MPRRRCAALAAAVIALGLTACSDDDDAGNEVEREDDAPGTTSDVIVEVTPPLEMQASLDPDFVTDVLADDVVTGEELTDGFQRYIECVADGGAAGIYAFDLDLQVMLHEWSLPSATADRNEAASLNASCSRDFLGDLILRYKEANPGGPELAERRRDSLVACIAAVNPDIAAKIPDEIPTDTTGAGATGEDLQLDPTALGADLDEIEPVRRCIGSFGVEFATFG